MAKLSSAIVLFTLLGACSTCVAEPETLLIVKPFKARHLAGTVVDRMGAPIASAHVTVIPCVSDVSEGTIETTAVPKPREAWTDAKGWFSIDPMDGKSSHCLYIGADNFNPLQVKVVKSYWHGDLKLQMDVGT